MAAQGYGTCPIFILQLMEYEGKRWDYACFSFLKDILGAALRKVRKQRQTLDIGLLCHRRAQKLGVFTLDLLLSEAVDSCSWPMG